MTQPSSITIGLIQHACTADLSANMDKAEAGVREAAGKGAKIICLQELYRGLYFCQKEDAALFDQAEPVPGPSTERFGPLAKELGVALVVSIFEKRAPGLHHNSVVVLDADGASLGLYRKMHIPDDPLYYEKYYFTPGDLGYKTFATRHGKCGPLICWDQWYPEAARLTALSGAPVLFYPTAIGWHPREKDEFGAAQRDAWMTMQRSHAIANGVFVAAVNRVGTERSDAGELEFWGSSFVADPFGRILAQSSEDREETVVVECDLRLIEETRRNWPFLRDRRVDSFADLTRRFLD